MLALAAGVVMISAALVVDNGTHHRVRAETQAVCDSAALAGMAALADSRDPDDAHEAVLETCAANGYVDGSDGVTVIESYGYNSDSLDVNTDDGDRYHVKISRELPQRIMGAFGLQRTGVTTMAVAALVTSAPMDVETELGLDANFGRRFGFPDKASVAQMGPAGSHQLGDAFSTTVLDNGDPNTLYTPKGLRYDLVVPPDLGANGHSTLVRVELFDPDCINDWNKSSINNAQHVIQTPERLVDTDGDETEPERGALDEILPPASGVGGTTKPSNFGARSTQTVFELYNADETTPFATATYGPAGVTRFWYQDEDPATAALRNPASSGLTPTTQLATDLKWITPQGFQFDTATREGPYYMMVRTTSGSSENGYSVRVSTLRAQGQKFNWSVHGLTETSMLGAYAHGKMVINFMDIYETEFTIASVPQGTTQVHISNFDTEVAGCDLDYSMSSYHNGNSFPVLFDMSASNSSHGVVTDTQGNQYRLSITGTRSPNRQWRSDTIGLPETIKVPRTDADGNLVFDAQGRIEITDELDQLPGGEVQLVYRAGNPGQGDTSSWEVGYRTEEFQSGEQQIMLIR